MYVCMYVCMTIRPPHLGRYLGFFKIFIFSKTAENVLEISRKHIFYSLKREYIKNKVEKNKLKQVLSNSYTDFLIHLHN